MTRTVQAKLTHYAWLDWLRFGAALMVVLAHARVHLWTKWADLVPADRTPAFAIFLAVIRQGMPAVLLFFVLSGYLVGGKLWERAREGSFVLGDYFADRLSRIYVPLVPALAVTAAIHFYVSGEAPWRYPGELAGNFFSVQGIFCDVLRDNGALWSLSYEVWFYILGGAMAVVALPAIPGSTRRLFLGLVVIFASLAVFSVLDATLLFCWLLGAAAYVLAPRLQPLLFTGFGLVLVAGGAAGLARYENPGAAVTPAWNASDLAVAAGAALILPRIARSYPTGAWPIRLESFGGRLAAFSYTLYLTHVPVLALYSKMRSDFLYPATSVLSFACFGLVVLSCVAFAFLLYLPFERQTPSVRRWLRRRFGSRRDASAS